ncbi:MAG TPA: ElyC/SanA/YdcF family protein [Candidatus Paceibacterota bacterium]
MPFRKIILTIVAAALTAALLCAGLYAYIVYATQKSIFSSIDALPSAQTALVLGASVTSGGALSPVLKERADEAIVLYNTHKVTKILVTGDNATLSHDEVDPVGKYMVAAGIPKADIFLDHAGFDTYSSMYRARTVFEVTSMIVVSQPFHLPRAVFIAQALGLTAYGMDAGKGELFLYNDIREIPASVKAVYDLLFARVPKFLGEQYPITGDGSATWGGASTTTPIWQ